MTSDHIKEQVEITMNIVSNYIDEMMNELITTIEGSTIDTFTKEEMIVMLRVHSLESQNRIHKSVLMGNKE